jgi:hypothetical protein
MAVTQVAQDDALVIAVADFLGDGQDLAVQVDRLPVASETVVAAPQVAEGGALAVAVADLSGDGQGLGVQVDRLPVVTKT